MSDPSPRNGPRRRDLLGLNSRVARRLLAMVTGHGMLAPGITHLTIAVNQEQLGAMLSLTRQTISEVLREFEAQGWLKRRYGAIELLDTAADHRRVLGAQVQQGAQRRARVTLGALLEVASGEDEHDDPGGRLEVDVRGGVAAGDRQ